MENFTKFISVNLKLRDEIKVNFQFEKESKKVKCYYIYKIINKVFIVPFMRYYFS